jgi:hypothetical protein
MVTSEGPVDLGSISPRFKRQLQGRYLDTMGAHSKAVLDTLYPGQGIKKSKSTGTHRVELHVAPARSHLGKHLVEYRTLAAKKHRTKAEKDRMKVLRGRLRRAKLIS